MGAYKRFRIKRFDSILTYKWELPNCTCTAIIDCSNNTKLWLVTKFSVQQALNINNWLLIRNNFLKTFNIYYTYRIPIFDVRTTIINILLSTFYYQDKTQIFYTYFKILILFGNIFIYNPIYCFHPLRFISSFHFVNTYGYVVVAGGGNFNQPFFTKTTRFEHHTPLL